MLAPPPSLCVVARAFLTDTLTQDVRAFPNVRNVDANFAPLHLLVVFFFHPFELGHVIE
jgi:hypothetical protein